MEPDFEWVQGDTALVATDQLELNDGSHPDLTGATVQLVRRTLTSTTPSTLTGTVTITDPIAAAIRYAPSAADTATSGQFMGQWKVTFPDGGIMHFPTRGYLWIEIYENLETVGGQLLVSLPAVKDHLNIRRDDRTHDAKLVRFIHAIRPIVEKITGPIIPTVFEEWHDGGQYFIQLRRRPSTGYGTSPVLDLIGCDEYRGPIKYSLSVIADPAAGSIYSVHMDRLGKVTRRTSGGGVVAFPAMPESVHVFYRAGQSDVPWNVHEATLELIRINYRSTQPTGKGFSSVADLQDQSGLPQGFSIPRDISRWLAPNRRAPAIA